MTRPPPSTPAGQKFTLLCVASLTVMAGATISAALPGIATHFAEVPRADLLTRFVLTVPGLFIALFAPVSGWMIDRFGRRRILLAALVLYALGGTSGLWAPGLAALLAGRALLGLAVAATMTAATALVGDYYDGAERERLIGFQASFMGFGGLLFLTGGGLLAEMHWRAPFAIYAVALLLLPAALAFLPEPDRTAASPLTGSSAGSERLGLAILGLFLLAFGVMAAFYMLPINLPFYLQDLGVESPFRAGLALGVMTLTSATVSFTFARLKARMNARAIFALAFGLLTIGFGGLYLSDGYSGILLATPLVGAGMGLAMPNLMAAAMALAPPAARGRVSGGVTASIFAGQFLSPLVAAPLIEAWGYGPAYGAVGIVLLVAAICLGTLGARFRRQRMA